jgi:small subunit ribosomal protein S27Ae
MADVKPKAPVGAKGKKKKNKSAMYDLSADTAKRKSLSCPKCGPGVFMASHKDRYTCGNCGFTQWKSK